MSALYNVLMKRNHISDRLFTIIGLTQEEIRKFRDIWINPEGTKIMILHVNDGEKGIDADLRIAENPNFVSREIWESDNSFAIYHFSIPKNKEVKEIAKSLAKISDTEHRLKKYARTLENMFTTGEGFQTFKTIGDKILRAKDYAEKEGIADVEHGDGRLIIDPNDPDLYRDSDKDEE